MHQDFLAEDSIQIECPASMGDLEISVKVNVKVLEIKDDGLTVQMQDGGAVAFVSFDRVTRNYSQEMRETALAWAAANSEYQTLPWQAKASFRAQAI